MAGEVFRWIGKGKIGSDLVFSLEFIHEVVDKTVVEILAALAARISWLLLGGLSI